MYYIFAGWMCEIDNNTLKLTRIWIQAPSPNESTSTLGLRTERGSVRSSFARCGFYGLAKGRLSQMRNLKFRSQLSLFRRTARPAAAAVGQRTNSIPTFAQSPHQGSSIFPTAAVDARRVVLVSQFNDGGGDGALRSIRNCIRVS